VQSSVRDSTDTSSELSLDDDLEQPHISRGNNNGDRTRASTNQQRYDLASKVVEVNGKALALAESSSDSAYGSQSRSRGRDTQSRAP
jgi:hypothetical protein